MTACLDCGRPGQRGSRCPGCESRRKAAHDAAYGPEYEREARKVRAEAGERCPRCGAKYSPTNPVTAGHAIPVREGGSTADGLEAQCRRCNYGWKRTGL